MISHPIPESQEDRAARKKRFMALLAATAGIVPFLSREGNKEGPRITQRVVPPDNALEQQGVPSDSHLTPSLRRKPKPKGDTVKSVMPPTGTISGRAVTVQTSVRPKLAEPIDSVEVMFRKMKSVNEDPEDNHTDNAFLKNVAGIGMVELPAEDLARLGIRVIDAGIYWTSLRPGTSSPSFSIMTSTDFISDRSPFNLFDRRISADSIASLKKGVGVVEVPDFAPIMITDDAGTYRMIFEFQDDPASPEEKIANQISTLIGDTLNTGVEQRIIKDAISVGGLVPVLIRTGRTTSSADSLVPTFPPDAIFWYRPTAGFLERLPASVRSRIDQEMAFAERLRKIGNAGAENPELRAAIASDIKARVGESPYLDVLRESGGALAESSITPNPTHGNVTLKYRLSLPRTLSLTLHDITGRHLRQLGFPGLKSAGQWQEELNLTGLANGIYLVVITTQQGERAIQRVVVQR